MWQAIVVACTSLTYWRLNPGQRSLFLNMLYVDLSMRSLVKGLLMTSTMLQIATTRASNAIQ